MLCVFQCKEETLKFAIMITRYCVLCNRTEYSYFIRISTATQNIHVQRIAGELIDVTVQVSENGVQRKYNTKILHHG